MDEVMLKDAAILRRTQSASAVEMSMCDPARTSASDHFSGQAQNDSEATSEDTSDCLVEPDSQRTNPVKAVRRASSEAISENGPKEEQTTIAAVFPSISDGILEQLGLRVRAIRGEPYSDHEIENRFIALSLAFKTDLLTLVKRVELLKRHRDQAEINMAAEVTKLKAALHKLSRVYVNSDSVEALAQIQTQVDVLQQATDKVSGSAEMFGAVQQENRLSRATEVLMLHVENIKRSMEKLANELEDVKKVLADNNIIMEDADLLDEPTPRTMRYRSLSAVTAKNLGSKRRASIAAMPRLLGSSPETDSKARSHMANVVNTLRMKSSLSSINALVSSTAVSCDWPERMEDTMGPIEEMTEAQKAKVAAVENSPVSEVNNNLKEGVGNVDEPENERSRSPRSSIFDSSDNRKYKHEDLSLSAQLVNPVQFLKNEVKRLLVISRKAIIEYVQVNKVEIIHKIRYSLAAIMFAAAAWCLLWTLIPLVDTIFEAL